MNHLVVLYYFFSILVAMAGTALIGYTWLKTKNPLLQRIFLFHAFLLVHTVTATLNYYVAAIAGVGFENPAVQAIYTAFLFGFFAVFSNLLPWFGSALVDRPWRGWPRWALLSLSLAGLFLPVVPLFQQVPVERYLPSLWNLLYGGYINLVWVGFLAFLILTLTSYRHLSKSDDRKAYTRQFIVIGLVCWPGLVADQLWDLLQVQLQWVLRGFTFEPLFLVGLTVLSVRFCLKKAQPSAAESLSAPAQAERREKYGLSNREWEVLVLAAEGRTNQEIGAQLFISEGTVKNHIHNILEKTSLRSRWELAKLLQP